MRRHIECSVDRLAVLAATSLLSAAAITGCGHPPNPIASVPTLTAPEIVPPTVAVAIAPAVAPPSQTVQTPPLWTPLQPGLYSTVADAEAPPESSAAGAGTAPVSAEPSREPNIRLGDFHLGIAALGVGRSRVSGSVRVDNFGPYNVTDFQVSLYSLRSGRSYTLMPAQSIAPYYRGPHGHPIPIRQGELQTFDVAVVLPPGEVDGGVNLQIEARIDGPPGLYVHREGVVRGRSL